MMKICIALLPFIYFLSSLSCKEASIQKTALTSTKMTAVFSDILKLKVYNDSALTKVINKDSVYQIQLHTILYRHNISDSDFRTYYRQLVHNNDSLVQLLKNIKF